MDYADRATRSQELLAAHRTLRGRRGKRDSSAILDGRDPQCSASGVAQTLRAPCTGALPRDKLIKVLTAAGKRCAEARPDGGLTSCSTPSCRRASESPMSEASCRLRARCNMDGKIFYRSPPRKIGIARVAHGGLPIPLPHQRQERLHRPTSGDGWTTRTVGSVHEDWPRYDCEPPLTAEVTARPFELLGPGARGC